MNSRGNLRQRFLHFPFILEQWRWFQLTPPVSCSTDDSGNSSDPLSFDLLKKICLFSLVGLRGIYIFSKMQGAKMLMVPAIRSLIILTFCCFSIFLRSPELWLVVSPAHVSAHVPAQPGWFQGIGCPGSKDFGAFCPGMLGL